MSASLRDRTVVVIGRGGGIARAVALSIRRAGGTAVGATDGISLGIDGGEPLV
jgi:rhodanese-related sulfurtransferase